MTLSIHLLGKPRLTRDGRDADPPRGRKAWALLAHLALSERPPSRRELAELLFADADDPLGALRWSLSQLRKALAPEATVEGDPVRLDLGDAELDAAALLACPLLTPEEARGIGAELLDGVEPSGARVFDAWLAVERRRLAGAAETTFHESALARLAAGDPSGALELARSAMSINPLEEGNQELLVRCLAASGDREGALDQVRACEELFRRELGIDPSPAVLRAADAAPPDGGRSNARPAAARALLEAGRAAISAGASESGIGTLREACDQAAKAHDPALRAEALTALGIGLVHAVRGWDGEGAASLHRALVLAEEVGDRSTAVTAHRELGWVGAVSGRPEQAQAHLQQASELAEGAEEMAGVLGIWGMISSDAADYPRARAQLDESIELATSAGDHRQRAYNESMLARWHLLNGELEQARSHAGRSVAAATEENWMAFIPFPEAIYAEADRQAGESEAALERFEHAFALGCKLEDPCWEALGARGLGMLADEAGDNRKAESWLGEAVVRCTRWPDRYEWVHAYALDSGACVALANGDASRARTLALRLSAAAERAGLRELACRALLTRARLGEDEALGAAEVLARQIENPALSAELEAPAAAR